MRRTNLVIIGCVSGILGVYSGRYYDVSFLPLLLAITVLLIIRNKRFRYVAGVILLAFWLGNIRGVAHNSNFGRLRAHFETKITAEVSSLDDAEYDSRSQLAFNATDIVIDGVHMPGQLAVSGFGEFSVLRGDRVAVTGKLLPARGSNQARISFAQMNTVSKDISWYNKLRRQFIKKLRDNLPEPLSSFAAGLIIGQRTTIPDNITTDLRSAGLAHIIAVSGYNLTIIIRFFMSALRRLSRYQKLMSSLSVIVAFLLITGFSASIVRASIVSGLSLLAWYYGKSFRPAVLLLFAALVTVLYRPEYVWGDVGWYLSFLAFGGIMIISPILKNRLFPGKELKLLPTTLLDTCSVLIAVVPYSLYIFGTLSVVALPANIVVAPMIPLAMALTMLTSLLPYQLAILATPTILLLDGILSVTHIFANLPFSHIDFRIHLLDMYGLYILIGIVVFLVWNKTKQRLESSLLLQ